MVQLFYIITVPHNVKLIFNHLYFQTNQGLWIKQMVHTSFFPTLNMFWEPSLNTLITPLKSITLHQYFTFKCTEKVISGTQWLVHNTIYGHPTGLLLVFSHLLKKVYIFDLLVLKKNYNFQNKNVLKFILNMLFDLS